VAKVAAVETLLNPQGFAMRMSESIQPAPVIESRRIDHQRIAIPFADRVAHPRRLGIHRELASIRIDLAEHVVHLVQDRDHSRSLNDLEGIIGEEIVAHDALWKTLCRRIGSRVLRVLSSQFGGLGLYRRLVGLEVSQDVEEVLGEGARVVSRNRILENIAE
jgi:hypothetical protein